MPDTQTVVFVKRVTLTNAQIKALPSTPVELLAAPGTNKRIVPIGGQVIFKTSVAYSNVGFNGSDAGVTAFLTLPLCFSVLPYTTVYQALVAAIPQECGLLPRYVLYGASDIEVTNGNASEGSIRSVERIAINSPLRLGVDNYTAGYGEDLGDFTGGDAANTMEVTIFHSICDEG